MGEQRHDSGFLTAVTFRAVARFLCHLVSPGSIFLQNTSHVAVHDYRRLFVLKVAVHRSSHPRFGSNLFSGHGHATRTALHGQAHGRVDNAGVAHRLTIRAGEPTCSPGTQRMSPGTSWTSRSRKLPTPARRKIAGAVVPLGTCRVV